MCCLAVYITVAFAVECHLDSVLNIYTWWRVLERCSAAMNTSCSGRGPRCSASTLHGGSECIQQQFLGIHFILLTSVDNSLTHDAHTHVQKENTQIYKIKYTHL